MIGRKKWEKLLQMRFAKFRSKYHVRMKHLVAKVITSLLITCKTISHIYSGMHAYIWVSVKAICKHLACLLLQFSKYKLS
jgi:hypothetical protein